jgi:hypothetical protein
MKETDHPRENPRLPRFVVTTGIVFVLLIVAMVWLYSSMSLPFETISKDDFGGDYWYGKTGILVFADKSDVLQPVSGIEYPAKISQQLMAVDYQRSIAILALRGHGACCSFKVSIQWIGHLVNQVILLTEFTGAEPGGWYKWILTTPYHLVLIPRDSFHGELRFSLRDGLREVAATTRQLP